MKIRSATFATKLSEQSLVDCDTNDSACSGEFEVVIFKTF